MQRYTVHTISTPDADARGFHCIIEHGHGTILMFSPAQRGLAGEVVLQLEAAYDKGQDAAARTAIEVFTR